MKKVATRGTARSPHDFKQIARSTRITPNATARSSISAAKPLLDDKMDKRSPLPHFGTDSSISYSPLSTSHALSKLGNTRSREPQLQNTSISLSELNKKFFYNPKQTPRKMAEYAARRSHNASPEIAPRAAKPRGGGGALSRSMLPSHSVSTSMLFTDPDKPSSPSNKGLQLLPPRERAKTPENKSLDRPLDAKRKQAERMRELEENARRYQNIVMQLQKKNEFLETELKKVQERSRIEKQKTMQEIEHVSQNYRKYADYYKRYLNEKNQFDRAQRDLLTLHLRIDNASRFLQEFAQSNLGIVDIALQAQLALRSPESTGLIPSVDSSLAQIAQGLLGKLEEAERTPLGLSLGEQKAELLQRQLDIGKIPVGEWGAKMTGPVAMSFEQGDPEFFQGKEAGSWALEDLSHEDRALPVIETEQTMSRKTLGTLDIKPQEVVVSDRALTAQASEPYFPCKTLEATEEQPKVAREREMTKNSIALSEGPQEAKNGSLMSTIRALNNQLDKIEGIGPVEDGSGGHRSNQSSALNRLHETNNYLYDTGELKERKGSEPSKVTQTNTATGTPQFEKDIRHALEGATTSGDNDGSISSPSGNKKLEIAVALYDFTGQREGDMQFKQGQQILILNRKEQHNWWLGTMGSGKQGWFPKNFVRVESFAP